MVTFWRSRYSSNGIAYFRETPAISLNFATSIDRSFVWSAYSFSFRIKRIYSRGGKIKIVRGLYDDARIRHEMHQFPLRVPIHLRSGGRLTDGFVKFWNFKAGCFINFGQRRDKACFVFSKCLRMRRRPDQIARWPSRAPRVRRLR